MGRPWRYSREERDDGRQRPQNTSRRSLGKDPQLTHATEYSTELEDVGCSAALSRARWIAKLTRSKGATCRLPLAMVTMIIIYVFITGDRQMLRRTISVL